MAAGACGGGGMNLPSPTRRQGGAGRAALWWRAARRRSASDRRWLGDICLRLQEARSIQASYAVLCGPERGSKWFLLVRSDGTSAKQVIITGSRVPLEL